MPTRISQLINVPEDLYPTIVESYYRDGAINVIPKPMADGTWVVTAEFEVTPHPREGMLAYMRSPARQKKTIISEAS